METRKHVENYVLDDSVGYCYLTLLRATRSMNMYSVFMYERIPLFESLIDHITIFTVVPRKKIITMSERSLVLSAPTPFFFPWGS